MKRILKYLFLLLLIYPISIYAEEININKLGSFKISYLYNDKTLDGDINIYKIANINSNGDFTYLSDYTIEDSLDVDSTSKWNDLANKISKYIKDNNINNLDSCKTQNGVCEFSNLSTGLYLIIPNEVRDSNYIYNSFPTLISLPNYNELDKVYIYDEDILLKTEAKAITIDTKEETNNTTNVVPKTLDMFYTYLIIFVISIVIIVFVVLYINHLRKKEKKNEKNN